MSFSVCVLHGLNVGQQSAQRWNSCDSRTGPLLLLESLLSLNTELWKMAMWLPGQTWLKSDQSEVGVEWNKSVHDYSEVTILNAIMIYLESITLYSNCSARLTAPSALIKVLLVCKRACQVLIWDSKVSSWIVVVRQEGDTRFSWKNPLFSYAFKLPHNVTL